MTDSHLKVRAEFKHLLSTYCVQALPDAAPDDLTRNKGDDGAVMEQV